MKGLMNSQNLAAFTNTENQVTGCMQPYNLLHNLAAPRETIRSVALPTSRDTVAECRVEELKAMITTRGGGVTGRDGKAYSKEAMQRIVRAYLSMEKENTRSTVYFNRAQGGNGIFAKIDTSERKSAREILNQLVRCKEFEPSLQRFFEDIRLMFLAGGFVDQLCCSRSCRQETQSFPLIRNLI